MAEVLRGRGCDVHLAAIEFTDAQSDTASRVLGGKPFAAAVCCRRYWKHNLKTVRRLGTERGGVSPTGWQTAHGSAPVKQDIT